MNIFFSPCYKVSAYCGTLVISIWVNYRLLGNFAATIFVCVCVCRVGTCVCKAANCNRCAARIFKTCIP